MPAVDSCIVLADHGFFPLLFSLPPRSLRHRMRRPEAVVQAEISRSSPRQLAPERNELRRLDEAMPRWRGRYQDDGLHCG